MKKLLLACVFLAGCCSQPMTEEQKQAQHQANLNATWGPNLPPGATEITQVGNGWVTFRWHNKKYLYQLAGTHGGHSAIVELKED